MLNATKRTVMIESAAIGGIKLFINAPIVEPNKTLGIMIITILQSTKLVGFYGCLLKINAMQLKRAVPKIKGQHRVVAADYVQSRASIKRMTLNYPKEFPEVLQMALAIGNKQQIAMG